MGLLFKNNAETTLSGGINDSVTTIPVASAAVFPTPSANNVFFATIDDGTNVEVVKVTGISSNDLTVVREQDNTSASAFSTGAKIELRLNAKVLEMGTASLTDLDDDTKILVEETADEDKIKFKAAGTEIARIDSTGLGIGGINPTKKFHVSIAGDASLFDRTGSAGGVMQFANGGTVKGNVGVNSSGFGLGGGFRDPDLFIATGGNVGIGTTSPASLFHVEKAGSENDLILRANTGGTGSAQGGRLVLQLGAMSNSGSGNADTQAGDVLGKVRFDGQGTDFSYQGGEVSVVVQTGDGDDIRGNQGTMMQFHTMNVGVGFAQEKFRIAQNGDLTATDTSIGSLSDERIKKNITDFTGGLDIVKSLQPRNFEFKDETGKRKSGIRRGFVAQEVLEVDDYWIYEQEANDKDDPEYEYTKDTEKVYISNLTDKDAMYVSAIKELQAQIETLKSEINTLKGK